VRPHGGERLRTRLNKVEWAIRRYRRASQLAVLLLLILAPFLHIFRFDIPTMSLYLFGMRLWVKHFFFFSLLVTVVIYVVIAASVVFGRVFCGWVCPQNLFNELGRQWDAKFGRPGTIALSGLIGLFGGFVVWSYGTDGIALLRQYAAGEVPVAPTVTILAFGAFFTMAMAWWRTSVCRVACPYGHLQSILSGAGTMHLELFNLAENRDICASCGLCYETCHMAVDPRTTVQKDCVTCGDCLDACQLVSQARKVPRVLNFVVGTGETKVKVGSQGAFGGRSLKVLLPRLALPAVLVVLLSGVTAWGLSNRDLVSIVVSKDHRSVLTTGGTQSSGAVMRVSIMNLSGTTDTFRLATNGLPEGWAHFEQESVTLAPGDGADIPLRITPTESAKGLHNFEVTVTGANSGIIERFQTVHFVGN
jgi:polyferredoxin